MFANALKVAPSEAHWPAKPARATRACARDRRSAHAEDLDAFLASLASAERLACLAAARLPRGGARPRRSWRARRSRITSVVESALRARGCPRFRSSSASYFRFSRSSRRRPPSFAPSSIAALAVRLAIASSPYIQIRRRSQPVNQWGELNHSLRWSTLHLVAQR